MLIQFNLSEVLGFDEMGNFVLGEGLLNVAFHPIVSLGFFDVVPMNTGREDHHVARYLVALQKKKKLPTVHFWHVDVQKDEVGLRNFLVSEHFNQTISILVGRNVGLWHAKSEELTIQHVV